jgi:hypothetical protein
MMPVRAEDKLKMKVVETLNCFIFRHPKISQLTNRNTLSHGWFGSLKQKRLAFCRRKSFRTEQSASGKRVIVAMSCKYAGPVSERTESTIDFGSLHYPDDILRYGNWLREISGKRIRMVRSRTYAGVA